MNGVMQGRYLNRTVTLTLGFLVAAYLALAPASAQQVDSYKRFQEYYRTGNYAAALIEAQKLEADAKARFGTNHTSYAAALHNLGLVNTAQRKYGEAEALYQRALAIREQALGK